MAQKLWDFRRRNYGTARRNCGILHTPTGSVWSIGRTTLTGDTTRITSTDPLTSSYHVDMSLAYDSQARPITVTGLQGGAPITVTMGYNAAGQRSRYTVAMSGTATVDERFQYRDGDLAQMAAMTATLNGDGSVKSTGSYTDTYVYTANGQPLELLRQRGTTTSRYWYVLDGRNNVVALTDVNGAVVDRYAYDPWGEGLPEGTNETVPQPFRYDAPAHMSGWYLTTEDYNGDIETMKVEHLYHVTASRPETARYIALPPGSWFTLWEDGDDVGHSNDLAH